MVSIFLALIFGLALLFHFARMGVGLNTQLLNVADIQVHCSILMAHFALEDLPTQRKHAKAFFPSKVLFLLRAVRTASESTEKCVQSTEISVQFGPVRTQRTFFEKAHLFLRVRPSISQSYFSSWHQKIKATDVLKPVYLLQKCRDVHIFAPAAHCKKQANMLYCDRNCGSKVVQTIISSFSHAPGSDCCVRVADPTSNKKNTKRSHYSA